MAGSLSGVHRLQVDKPHPFKPIEERKHGGKTHHVDGKAEHHKLGRKRGGSVKKKSDGGNVTTVGKTKETGPDDYPTVSGKPLLADSKYNAPADKYFALPVKSYGWFGAPSKEKSEDRLSRAKGGKVDTPDRGTKYGTHTQPTPMAGTESGYGGKFAHGKGHIEDSLKDGGKVKWIQKAHIKKGAETAAAERAGMGVHEYMEKHKHDSGKAGRRARLGLTLSAMAKHKHKD